MYVTKRLRTVLILLTKFTIIQVYEQVNKVNIHKVMEKFKSFFMSFFITIGVLLCCADSFVVNMIGVIVLTCTAALTYAFNDEK